MHSQFARRYASAAALNQLSKIIPGGGKCVTLLQKQQKTNQRSVKLHVLRGVIYDRFILHRLFLGIGQTFGNPESVWLPLKDEF